MKCYLVKISGVEFKSIGVAALDKKDAAIIANERCKEYGYLPCEFSIESVTKHGNGRCDWEIGTSVIYN